MCGIAGIVSLNQTAKYQIANVLHMAKAMQNRGPDDEGYSIVLQDFSIKQYFGDDSPIGVRQLIPESTLITDCPEEPSLVAFSHRRLSILDVSAAGHQPMTDTSGNYMIVFNGEIYNFRELRAQLEGLGKRFKTRTDTEVILASYIEWGESCLKRFNGDFAFSIWDGQKKCLFCARDRIGIKPFYYLLIDDQFLFASDIKTLIASGLYTPTVDETGLSLAMAFGIAPRPITAFQDIRALEQGHTMVVTLDGQVRKNCYWKIPVGTQDHSLSEANAVEGLDAELRKSIDLRLVSDVPIGTFMSGGIDSTTISSMAAEAHPGIKAITLGFDEEANELNEVAQAVETAKLHPMTHIVHQVKPETTLRNLADWIDCYEEPFFSMAANDTISKTAKQNNLTVVLNGLGGDELFGGYWYYKYKNFIRHRRFLKPFRYAAQYLKIKGLDKLDILLSDMTFDRMHTLLFQQHSDSFLQNLFRKNSPFKPTADLVHQLYAQDVKFEDPTEAFNYMDIMNYIGNHHVHRVDQFTMRHSIEGRFPFLDHNVIEMAFRTPTNLKIRRGKRKYILRKVAEKYIHPSCLQMSKKGFSLPLRHWLAGPLRPIVEIQLRNLEQREIINPTFVASIFKNFKSHEYKATEVWHLVALELWFKRFIDQTDISLSL